MERWGNEGWKKYERKRGDYDQIEELKKQKKRENSRRHTNMRNNDKENIMKNMNLYETSVNGTNKKEDKMGLVERKYFR